MILLPCRIRGFCTESRGVFSAAPGFCFYIKILCDRMAPRSSPQLPPVVSRKSPTIWKIPLASAGENPVRDYCMKHDCIRIGWDEYEETVTGEMDCHVGGKNCAQRFLSKMQPGGIILSCHTSRSIDAIGVATGEPEWHPEFDFYKRSGREQSNGRREKKH